MLSKFRRVRGEKGFTLIEFLIVIAIIGILAAIAIPQFSAYKNRAYQSDSKAALQNLFMACKAYWADKTPMTNCEVSEVKAEEYGFTKSDDVTVAVTMKTAADFAATALHGADSTSVTYTIDKNGVITP